MILIFAVLIIPVYLVNLWMNSMGLSEIKRQAEASSTNNLKFYASQLNDQLHFIRNSQQQLLTDSNLQKLAFRAGMLMPFEEYDLVGRISERLATIRNTSDYVVNVGVELKANRRTISTSRGVSSLEDEEWETIEPIVLQRPAPMIHYGGGRLFFFAYANNASITSYLELSVPHLLSTLNRLAPYASSGVVLTDNRFAQMISSKYDKQILEQIKLGAQSRESIQEEPSDSWTMKFQGSQYRISMERIPALGWTIYTYVNQNAITGTLDKYRLWFVLLSIVSVIVIVVFSFSVNRMIHRPLHKLIRAFNMIETDLVRAPAKRKDANEFDYLYRGFDNMVERLNKSIRENYENKLALQNSELKQLQSQINPHFLYNSFYNIYRMCKIGQYDKVAVLTQKLASYYQAITRSGADEVPLDKEYRHAMDYCEIQGIRFSNRIRVIAAEVPETCKSLMVPRLIIQPVIENAFEHAFENSVRPGHVHLAMTCEESRFRLCVEDDGIGLSDDSLAALQRRLGNASQEREKTGLINVCRRIRLKYGEASGVFVSRSEYGGMKAEIVIHRQ